MLSRFSIRSKIITVVAFMTVAMTLLGAFAVFQMRTINAAAHEIHATWLPSVRWLGEMRTQASRHRSNLRDHLLTTDMKIKQATDKQLDARMDDFNRAVKLYQPLISTDEERTIARELQAAWKAYMASVNEVLDYSRKGDNEMAIATNAATTIDLGRRTDALMAQLVELNYKGAEADGAYAQSDLRPRLLARGRQPGIGCHARRPHILRARARCLPRHRLDHRADAGTG